jgi:hypothetical protein
MIRLLIFHQLLPNITLPLLYTSNLCPHNHTFSISYLELNTNAKTTSIKQPDPSNMSHQLEIVYLIIQITNSILSSIIITLEYLKKLLNQTP